MPWWVIQLEFGMRGSCGQRSPPSENTWLFSLPGAISTWTSSGSPAYPVNHGTWPGSVKSRSPFSVGALW